MKQVISKIQARLDELDEDCTKWQPPPDVLIIDRCADAYAVGFRQALQDIQRIVSEIAS